MKLQYMKEFLILTKERNYTAAAKQLHMEQTTLSRHIIALEKELGAVLLERSTHAVAVTKQGNVASEYFKSILNSYEELTLKLSLTYEGYQNQLRIGILTHSMEKYIEPVYEQVMDAFPDTKISFAAREGNELIQDLLDGVIDLSLIVKVHFPCEEHVRFHKVKSEKLYVMVLKSDPLSGYDKISVKQLSGRNFVYVKSNNDYMDMVNEILALHNVRPAHIVYSLQEHTLIYTMKREQGVAIVMEQMKYNHSNQTHFIEIEEKGFELEICWAYKASNSSPILHTFISFMDHRLNPE